MGPAVSLVCLVPGAHLGKKVDLCPDRKETRGIRASRGLQGRLSTSILQRTCTLKERRVLEVLKACVGSRGCRVQTLCLGSKERRGFWDFLDLGDCLVILGQLGTKDSRGFGGVQVSPV